MKHYLLPIAMMTTVNLSALYDEDYDEVDAWIKQKEWEYEQEKEEERRRQEQEHTEHWTEEDEDGNITHWSSPRSLDVQMLTGQKRKELFHQAIELKRQAMRNLEDAYKLRKNIPDIDSKAIFTAIMIDCMTGCVEGFPVATCAACITELSCAACQKGYEFYEAQGLVRAAKALYEEAEKIEYILWFDDDAEDWA